MLLKLAFCDTPESDQEGLEVFTSKQLGEQGWRSRESPRLPPMWFRFDNLVPKAFFPSNVGEGKSGDEVAVRFRPGVICGLNLLLVLALLP